MTGTRPLSQPRGLNLGIDQLGCCPRPSSGRLSLSHFCRWPAQCDVAAGKRYLSAAYENARSQPMHEVLFTGSLPLKSRVQPMDIMKRCVG